MVSRRPINLKKFSVNLFWLSVVLKRFSVPKTTFFDLVVCGARSCLDMYSFIPQGLKLLSQMVSPLLCLHVWMMVVQTIIFLLRHLHSPFYFLKESGCVFIVSKQNPATSSCLFFRLIFLPEKEEKKRQEVKEIEENSETIFELFLKGKNCTSKFFCLTKNLRLSFGILCKLLKILK